MVASDGDQREPVGDEQPNEESSSHEPKPFKVLVSLRFLVLSCASSVLLAFAIGRAARILLLRPRHGHGHRFYPPSSGLPYPEILEGKEVPRTSYSSKNFDTAASASSSSVLVRRPASEEASPVCKENEQCLSETKLPKEDDDEHLPAGQHLLVDMKGVDSAFLDSEERLAKGIVETIKETQLTLLSYHCHTLVPSGVSCVGVLLESHISFHTWPAEGVITLDLFTCGSKPLVPVLPIIERYFAVPPVNAPSNKPTVLWSHKLRGFRKDHRNPLEAFDLGRCILGMMDMDLKKEVLSFETEYQRIDVYDVIHPRVRSIADYEKSLSNEESYQSRNPQLFAPDRVVHLDGIMQSSLYGDASYHEALVHPAMFAHDHPKRVGIIGGGEGATLREVLKHKTVEKAIMVEIDYEMVQVSHDYLPSWSDCSDFIGSAEWCIEDPRTAVYYEDALAWFIDRFYETESQKANLKQLDNSDPLDIIIVDALDPEDEVAFADALYNNGIFLKALYASLSDDGIIVLQLGASPRMKDPPEGLSKYKTRAILTKQLEEMGFESIHVYEESHSGFHAAWSYLVACKSYETRQNWYSTEPEIELEIHSRAMATRSGLSPFRYFDGATMVSYQQPHKSFETVFCKQDPTPTECKKLLSFDVDKPNALTSSFEVKKSKAGEQSGRGLFTKKDLTVGTYLAIDGTHQALHFLPYTFQLITSFMEYPETQALRVFDYYMDGYGFLSQERGGAEVCVDSTILTFVNHGCNGTYNVIKRIPGLTEFTADPDKMPDSLSGRGHQRLKAHNPVVDRHINQLQTSSFTLLRNVGAGEEILCNYLEFVGSKDYWKEDVLALRAQCSGEGIGEVADYEYEQSSQTD